MKLKDWRQIPMGGMIINPPNTQEYNTGTWRTMRPVLNKEKCIHCMQCWLFCPDEAIIVENEEMKGHSLVHCKGCGLCIASCRSGAINLSGFETGQIMAMINES